MLSLAGLATVSSSLLEVKVYGESLSECSGVVKGEMVMAALYTINGSFIYHLW